MTNELDCDTVVSEFELLSSYYVHFRTNTIGKGMNSLISLVMGKTVAVLVYSDGSGFNLPTKVDMLLIQTKTNNNVMLVNLSLVKEFLTNFHFWEALLYETLVHGIVSVIIPLNPSCWYKCRSLEPGGRMFG